MITRFLVLIFLVQSNLLRAQFTEDFSGSLQSPHQWSGDTSLFLINAAQQLQSNGPKASASLFLYTYSNALNTAAWTFSLQMAFESSTSNYAVVYLAASGHDRASAQFEAYYLKIGGLSGSKDGIDLYYQKGSSKQLLAKGVEGHAGGKTVSLRIKATHDAAGEWTVQSDSTGAENWTTEFKTQHVASFHAQYFGLSCVHSSTRRNGFIFDDIHIEGGQPDLDAPQLLNIHYESRRSLWRLTFNETLDVRSVAAFRPTDGSREEWKVKWNMEEENIVTVADTAGLLKAGTSWEMECRGLTDLAGNEVHSTVHFIYPKALQPGELVINELLFNPLPYGTDFIELYNRSRFYVAWDSLSFLNAEGAGSGITAGLMAPDSYRVFCADSLKVAHDYPLAAHDVYTEMELPDLPDDEGKVILLLAQDTLEEMSYSENMHHPLLDSKEGVSLERVEPWQASSWSGNWQSASASSGGATPGYRNSQWANTGSTAHDLEISPRSISPGTDGYRNYAVIRYTLPWKGASVRMDIFSLQGQWICSLVPSGPADRQGECLWNGIDSNLQPVATGLYLVLAEFYDQEGNRKKVKDTISVLSR